MQKKIKLSTGKEVIIAKLPIGKYAELLRAFKELPNKVSGMDKLDNETIIAELPTILADSLPEFLQILAIATPLAVEELQELGADDIVDLVLAAVEVNKYKEIVEKIKKALARPAQTTDGAKPKTQ